MSYFIFWNQRTAVRKKFEYFFIGSEHPLTAVTHKRIRQTRAGRVDKNVKFNIRQEHVGDTLEARYVVYAWCTLGAR